MNDNNRKRVLIVEDDKDTLILLKLCLKSLKAFSIVHAKDGIEAVKFLEDESFSLILSDWMMPNMLGIDLLRRKKDLPKAKNTPFIFITSENSPENVILACQEGAVDYIVKPWNMQVLTTKLQKYLNL